MPPASNARAALLAAAMNFSTLEPLDLLRFLRVPAIHFILRRETRRPARRCREAAHRRRRG